MNQTGATAQQAIDIRRYQDWEQLRAGRRMGPAGPWQHPAQPQRSQSRRAGFQWKWSEPEQAGSILPSYKVYENGSGGGPSRPE